MMDPECYKRDLLCILRDMIHYETVNNYPKPKTMAKLNTLIHSHPNGLTNKECDYRIQFDFKTSHFYCLPKIYMN